uniref:Uncharacterized protein n=1 Tax=Pseudomonas putida (strain ATCC 700007 / DSM 6899 / JCM 31910 / BCRC 17059 / LMG 24140 / F1) TaxID=351746 RepID=A5W0A7_PSEP1
MPSPVGAGSPAKRPGLPANLHPPFTVAAATVFAGKPAPTQIWWWTHVGGWTQPAVGAGLPAKRATRHQQLYSGHQSAVSLPLAGRITAVNG